VPAKTLFNASSGDPTITNGNSQIFPAIDVNNAGVNTFKILDDLTVHGHLNLIGGKFDQNGFDVGAFRFTNSIGGGYETNGGLLTILNTSLLFNGIDEFGEKILTGTSNILTQGTGDVAMGCWFKSTSSPTGARRIWSAIRNTTTATVRAIDILLIGSDGGGGNAGKIQVTLGDLQTPVTQVDLISDSAIIGDNQWHLVEFVRRSGVAFMFMDGVKQADSQASLHDFDIGVAFASFSLMVGAKNDLGGGPDSFFPGNVTRMFYVDGTVSDAVASARFNGGNPILSSTIATNIVSGYDVLEVSGFPTIPDDIASNDLTMVAMVECENLISDFPLVATAMANRGQIFSGPPRGNRPFGFSFR